MTMVRTLLLIYAFAIAAQAQTATPAATQDKPTAAAPATAQTAPAARRRRFGELPAPLPPELQAQLEKVQQNALTSDFAYRTLAHLCDNIGPRLSGSPQAAQAVQYVAEQMRALGADVTLEKVMVPHWVRGLETAELVEFPGMAPGTKQKIVVTALGGSVATPPDGITAEVIAVKDVAELKALGHDKVAGKIVLFTSRFDTEMARNGFPMEAYGSAVVVRAVGASEAGKLGAIASVIRSVGSAEYRIPHTGGTIYSEGAPKVPAGAVTSEDADTIADLVTQGTVRMHLTLTPRTLPDAESANVIADIKGSEHPEQVVIISGHLDSWDLGTGAIDDGAGVVSAMQAAATLKQLGMRPKKTIHIIAWMNEENGGRGSEQYAKDHADAAQTHVAAVELDSGAGHVLGFAAHAPARMLEKIEGMGLVLHSQGAEIMRPVNDAPGADITPLDKLGVPTFGVMNDGRHYFDYHHTPADTFSIVKKHELQENAAALSVIAWTLANLD